MSYRYYAEKIIDLMEGHCGKSYADEEWLTRVEEVVGGILREIEAMKCEWELNRSSGASIHDFKNRLASARYACEKVVKAIEAERGRSLGARSLDITYELNNIPYKLAAFEEVARG